MHVLEHLDKLPDVFFAFDVPRIGGAPFNGAAERFLIGLWQDEQVFYQLPGHRVQVVEVQFVVFWKVRSCFPGFASLHL